MSKKVNFACTLLLAGLLTVGCIGFLTMWRLSENEISEKGREAFSRSYETTVALLTEYLDGGSVGREIVFCLYGLPLDEAGKEACGQFSEDIANSRNESQAKYRADEYARRLFVYMSENRKELYGKGVMTVPEYISDGGYMIVSAEPIDEEYERSACRAEVLIGGSKKISSAELNNGYGTVLRFFTPDAYVEFERGSGRLIRLISASSGGCTVSFTSKEKVAAFCDSNFLPEMTVISTSENGGRVNVKLICLEGEGIASVEKETGILRAFCFKFR